MKESKDFEFYDARYMPKFQVGTPSSPEVIAVRNHASNRKYDGRT